MATLTRTRPLQIFFRGSALVSIVIERYTSRASSIPYLPTLPVAAILFRMNSGSTIWSDRSSPSAHSRRHCQVRFLVRYRQNWILVSRNETHLFVGVLRPICKQSAVAPAPVPGASLDLSIPDARGDQRFGVSTATNVRGIRCWGAFVSDRSLVKDRARTAGSRPSTA